MVYYPKADFHNPYYKEWTTAGDRKIPKETEKTRKNRKKPKATANFKFGNGFFSVFLLLPPLYPMASMVNVNGEIDCEKHASYVKPIRVVSTSA